MANSDNKQEVREALNLQVANFTVLWTKLHNYHWYVKGHNFFSLHDKFEELYDTASTYVDELAERLLAIGGEPIGKQSDAIEKASVKEAEYDIDANEMVRQLAQDYDTVIKELDEGRKIAEDAGDDRTADIFIGMITDIEKNNWMLKSFLGKEVSQ
ncbi:Dps family protein [Salinicoccus roseus]|jgi:starvation-inducible DNA-binding protein|uniref:DNA starvation/stationary phase protection protein n=3 Tax=Salinicoccus roseus TaxID=45670 RepID=A0A0C2DMC4_9STAP|nr:Dps family protein [Salinicoccus roseus]KIH71183.1 general stress protein [Salinicoccus roseus]MCG7331484.1 DNA starvation/stationary phase protection protein [Salinicoccus roseus]MDB0579908.1 DNA starvation/stationary phase protection protein [Salinicoccus roseus]OZT76337.1 DNA starvation/stationary phase protection protein [Salinicoccus roseus]RPE50918.1 starvation-inducible DNA-binding protein [Salinicoccus roseus]|tara:strand:+ start:84 stop:551 length:468 start_codon:yes stop_codon:yes gene_type:complete